MAERKLITWKQGAEIIGTHVSTLYRWAHSEPDFPKPIPVGPRTSRLDANELHAYIERRAAEREGAA